MIWVTADHHFGHGRIGGYCNRPWWRPALPEDLEPRNPLAKVARVVNGFVDPRFNNLDGEAQRSHWYEVPDVAAMEEELVTRWNARVSPEDTVYHLGDFAYWKLSIEEVARIRARLNGRVFLITGNHDVHPKTGEVLPGVRAAFERDGVAEVAGHVFAGQVAVLFHYGPTDPGNPRPDMGGSLLIHGHSHCAGGVRWRPHKQYPMGAVDVGVDGWDYAPVSVEEVLKFAREAPRQAPTAVF